MPTIEDKIKEIEDEIQRTSYNKATQHHIGKLKAKLAQLREDVIKRASSGGKGSGFAVKKSGNATAVLVGFPSVGKSTLINQITDAKSKTAEYEFTTVDVIPGLMEYNGAKIQILDIPGIISGASSGRGRGKEVLSITRNADLVLILIDVFNLKQLETIRRELYDVGIRLDQKPSKISIKKTLRGGINLISSKKLTRIDERTVMEILNVNGIHNAIVTVHEDITPEQLIDSVIGNRRYIPSVIAVNKIDLANEKQVKDVTEKIEGSVIPISAEKGINLDLLKKEIFRKLDMIRIYMKPQGKKPDMDEPLILKSGSTIEELCNSLHRDFKKKFRYAMIWGKSAKFDGQIVGLNHILMDGDIVTIVRRN